MTSLESIQASDYRIGGCQAIVYDPAKGDIFEDGFIGRFYSLCRRGRHGDTPAVLHACFGGNPPATFNAIVPCLAARPFIVVGEWREGVFHPAGIAFIQIVCGTAQTERAAFVGYLFLREFWGSEQIDTLMMLGLTILFQNYGLVAIHGTRYLDNTLTARFVARFGFRQVGEIPFYQLRGEKLVPAVVTTLLRSDFEVLAGKWLEEMRKPAVTPEASSLVAPLLADTIKAIRLPRNEPAPEIPANFKVAIIDGGFEGDGVWIYDPAKTSEIEIWVECGAGRHEALLAPVAPPEPVAKAIPQPEPVAAPEPVSAPTDRTVTLQAVVAGSVVAEATIPATAEAVVLQEKTFRQFYPNCDIQAAKEGKSQRHAKAGKARAAKMTPEERSEVARRAAEVRWEKQRGGE